MRSMSGIGMLSAVPNMSPADTCLGIWSTVLAEYRFVAARAPGSGPGRRAGRRGCGRWGCRGTRRPRRGRAARGSARGRARPRRRRRPTTPRATVARVAPAVARSRSGSASSCFSAVPFGHRKPWLNTSSRSPRTSVISSALEVQLEPARRLAQRAGPVDDVSVVSPFAGRHAPARLATPGSGSGRWPIACTSASCSRGATSPATILSPGRWSTSSYLDRRPRRPARRVAVDPAYGVASSSTCSAPTACASPACS